ncbi:hypothetical protein [Salinarimonas rosea]|uniref:hypothetical protein n=1 Tax=Salinarimonas rosea TaxID=552063 RepID=UPI000409E81B|nr:hypothetical protein [Salinarimonas rosea]
MKQQRRYAIAPSLVRLIRRERPGVRVLEGHFPDQPDRRSHVRLEGDRCELVLETLQDGAVSGEERTEVSRAQGEILLDVCAGKVSYERIRMDSGEGPIVVVDRYLAPSTAAVVRVAFDGEGEARAFGAPPWFGPELVGEEAVEPRALALGARPPLWEGPIADAALDSLLDHLDTRAPRFAGRGRDDAVLSALKRLARTDSPAGQAASAPAPAAAHPAPKAPPAQPAAAAPAPAGNGAKAAAPRPAPAAPPPASDSGDGAAEDALFEPVEPARPAKPPNGAAERPS